MTDWRLDESLVVPNNYTKERFVKCENRLTAAGRIRGRSSVRIVPPANSEILQRPSQLPKAEWWIPQKWAGEFFDTP